MKLKEYIEELNKLVENRPSLAFEDVVYARDDEGNGYENVHYTPSVMYFDEDMEAYSDREAKEAKEDGVALSTKVCIN